MSVDLREERERRGLSIDEVSRRSRIPRQYLDAIETGDREGLPRGPFFDSYQRQYLAFLGLPQTSQLVARRPARAPSGRSDAGPRPLAPPSVHGGLPAGAAAQATPRPVAPPPHAAGPAPASPGTAARGHGGPTLGFPVAVDEPPVEGTLPTDGRDASPDAAEDEHTRTITRQYDNVPVIRLVLAGFLATMALVLAMKLLSGLVDRAAESAAATPVAAAAPPEPAADDAPVVPPAAAAAARPDKPADDDAAVDPAVMPGMRVHLRAHERVRVSVSLDGSTAFSGWLEAGETHDFLGTDEVAVDVSDLTRLTIAYDGNRVDPLGNLSHPRRLVFLRDSS